MSSLANGSYIGALGLKSLTTSGIFYLIYKYIHGHEWNDPASLRASLSSFTSASIAELLMTLIVQRVLTLLGKDGNAGIKRIFDVGLNASTSGGLNIKFYEMLVKKAPNLEGSKWDNHEEFFAQLVADIVGEVLSGYFLVPLFGLNQQHHFHEG